MTEDKLNEGIEILNNLNSLKERLNVINRALNMPEHCNIRIEIASDPHTFIINNMKICTLKYLKDMIEDDIFILKTKLSKL